MPFIPNPWHILGVIALLALTAFTSASIATRLANAKWQEKELVTARAHSEALQKEYAARKREQDFNQAKARKASENHEKAVAAVHAAYAVRPDGGLRIPARTCTPARPAVGREAAGASGPDAPGAAGQQLPRRTDQGFLDLEPTGLATERLPTHIENGLFSLTLRADELAEQLRALQGWVRSHGFYGPAPDERH